MRLLRAAPIVFQLAAAGVAQEGGPLDEARLVRAYFDDIEVAYQAVVSMEAVESEYEKGYLVVLATERDIEVMRGAGMRIVEAGAGEAKYLSMVASAVEAPVRVGSPTISGYSCYRTVEETFASAQAIADTWPSLATWTDVGDSWKKEQDADEGYDLQVLVLTNSSTSGEKPELFVTTAIHAREYATAEFGIRFAEYMAENYETDADVRWLLDHHELHMMLQANPDGRKRAEAGAYWRKNHNTNHCSSRWQGVDLNRNFNFKWGSDYSGSSGSQCSQTYRGSAAESEPETKAVAGYMRELWTDARGPDDDDAAAADTAGLYLDIHSYSRLILWPWGHTRDVAPNGVALQTLGRKLAYDNGYVPHPLRGLYAANGTTNAYAYGELGRAAFTYELGTRFFQSCSHFRSDILEQNRRSVLYAFKVARAPYVLPKGPDALSVSLSGTASTTGVSAGTSVTLTATIDDTRYSTRRGTEATQTIAAAEYYVDTPPWSDGSTAVSMSASDGSFAAKSEGVTATVDTTGWSAGRHTLFVRGKDADGNWGPVSAAFLFVDEAPPSRPSAPVLTASAGELAVGWTAPSANGSDITGYVLRHKRADRDFGWEVEAAGTSLELALSEKHSNRRLDVQVRAVNAVGGSLWSESSSGKPANRPATGSPTVEGKPLVGSTLSAVTDGVSDADGLEGVSYSYQWVRTSGGRSRDIVGATDSEYEVRPADRGSTLTVDVSFRDDGGNEEELTGTGGLTAGALRASLSRSRISESSGAATIRVDTGGATLSADEVVELVFSGTATRGTDYRVDAYRLTVGASSTSASAVITPLDDAVDEGDERIGIAARWEGSSLPWGSTGSVVSVSVVLEDDDTRGVSVSESTLPVTEGSTASYTVVLMSEPSGSVTVTPSAPSGTDVSVSPSSLTFSSSAWDVPQSLTVSAAEDTDALADPPVVIRHGVSGADYGSTGASSVTATISENDTSSLSAVDVSGSEADGELSFVVSISVAGTSDVLVDFATSDGTARVGSDYTSVSGTLTFSQGSTSSETITVPLVDDGADEEEEETFALTLSNVRNGLLAGGGSRLRVTGTIRDDDDPEVTASFGRSRYPVTEGTSVPVVVRLDKDPERRLTLPLAATPRGASPADYLELPFEATFGPGEQRFEFPFETREDGEEEEVEEVELRFGSSLPDRVTAGGSTVLAINDNDGGGNDGGGGPGGPGGPGGGAPPPPPGDDDDDGDDDEDEDDDDGGGGFTPPRAAIGTDAACADGLCRALTGVPVRFEDRSTGSVQRRTWDFGEGSSRNASVNWSWSSPGFFEVTLLVSGGGHESSASLVFLVEAASPAGSCAADAATLCLQDSRFSVAVEWWTASGEGGAGRVVRRGSNDSGLFSFFDGGNWEMLVKVLDGCSLNGHVWVFAASATDLGYRVTVTDTVTGEAREYLNEAGREAEVIADVAAFAASCGGRQ